MKRLVTVAAALGTVVGLMGTIGCKKEAKAPIGGVIPGRRAAERSVIRFFDLVRLEKRDRALGALDESYTPVLKSLQELDGPRDRLVKALRESAHADLTLLLPKKELTSCPGLVEVVLGPPKQLGFECDEESGVVNVEVLLPDGTRKKAWAKIHKKGVPWKITMPFAYSADGKPSGPTPQETLAAISKAVAAMEPVMTKLAERLEAGEMIEDSEICEQLNQAGRPIAAALQRMIYGQTNIK